MSKKLNEITGYEIAGLTADLMMKLRKEVISIDEFKKFLTMRSSERSKIFGISNIEQSKIKLQKGNVIIDALTKGINPQQHFTKNKKVKYYLGDNFKKYVLKEVESINNLPQMNFSKHKFTEVIYDKEIMERFHISKSNGLLTQEEVLWGIAFLTSKQPNGEAGDLINNGNYTLIGYLLCDDGVIRVIYVGWYSDRSEWRCHCFCLDSWGAGGNVLSRN